MGEGQGEGELRMTHDVSRITNRLYGHELRTAILSFVSSLPEVARVNYLEYWNDQTYLIFLDPSTEDTRDGVETRLKLFLETDVAARSWGVRWRFYSTLDPVPSSATLWRRA